VAEDIQELDKVVEHDGLVLAALVRAHEDVVAAEPTRLVDVVERGIRRGCARRDERRRTSACGELALVGAPLVYVVSACMLACKQSQELL
jgi:hypothetical protein